MSVAVITTFVIQLTTNHLTNNLRTLRYITPDMGIP